MDMEYHCRNYKNSGWTNFANGIYIEPLMKMLKEMGETPYCIRYFGSYMVETIICKPDHVPRFKRSLEYNLNTYTEYIQKVKSELQKIEESGYGQIQGKVE